MWSWQRVARRSVPVFVLGLVSYVLDSNTSFFYYVIGYEYYRTS